MKEINQELELIAEQAKQLLCDSADEVCLTDISENKLVQRVTTDQSYIADAIIACPSLVCFFFFFCLIMTTLFCFFVSCGSVFYTSCRLCLGSRHHQMEKLEATCPSSYVPRHFGTSPSMV